VPIASFPVCHGLFRALAHWAAILSFVEEVVISIKGCIMAFIPCKPAGQGIKYIST
jgi:hypothetical protein